MAEIDYQLALLLQHKFEQEAKKPKEYSSDAVLAKTLQEQFRTENEVEKPNNSLVYKATKSTVNSNKCLTDPSWEVIDPTPDIHVLFISFNERFFSGALVAVCVSWSKRMTRCAGICCYQGRGGLCSITLSEPLLKLRPRKDLVETLLHEMIHAYLFVTNNNRDRDGHGPEFHKHMFRINKEAGTNITVYHDFHDEVRLYQQHWWRCDGPCQKRKPFFGMVRRATNRAPGPNDRWWAEHSRNCGGKFVKVKEPEKPPKKTASKENIKPKEDIRKYLSPTKNNGSAKGAANPKGVNNVHTITNGNDHIKKITSVIPNANIFGFNSLTGNPSNSKGKSVGTAVRNGSNTIVINKKPVKTKEVATNSTSTVKAEKDRTLSESSKNVDDTDYSVVRNHWLNKFSQGTSSGVKRTGSLDIPTISEKVPRVHTKSISHFDTNVEEVANCPVCLEVVPLAQFNNHLDECLEKPKMKDCIICGWEVLVAEYESHVTKCSDEVFDKPDDLDMKKCTVCEEMFPVAEFEKHVESCLLKLYDDMEEAYSDKDQHVDCLTCGKSILKSELSSHLDDCMGLSRVFDDDNDVAEEKTGSAEFNCPFCMILVPEVEMSAHIDSCLNTVTGSFQDELNKNILVSSMLEEDF